MLISHKAIGQNIKNARCEALLTQEQAASKVKMSQLHFGRLERGDRPASLEQLAQISLALNVSFSDLLAGSLPGDEFEPAPTRKAKEVAEVIAQLASGCSPEAQQMMISLCQVVALSEKKDPPEEE